jgi:hypothetical protein
MPVPVLVEDLRATAGAGGVRLAWRLASSVRDQLASIAVERSADGAAAAPLCATHLLTPAAEMEYVDASAVHGRTYYYRLILGWMGGAASVAGPIRIDVTDALRLRTSLEVPVDRGEGGIEIRYTLGQSSMPVSLDLYDVAGRHVRALDRGAQPAGSYVRLWDRRDDCRLASRARGLHRAAPRRCFAQPDPQAGFDSQLNDRNPGGAGPRQSRSRALESFV